MKKFALILIIVVMSTFASAAVASDFEYGWKWNFNPFKYFHGTFEMIASGSCIHSEKGYEKGIKAYDVLVAKTGTVYAGTTVANGSWTFYGNGKGTFWYKLYATVTPPVQENSTTPIPGGIRVFEPKNPIDFEFEVTPFGDITVTETVSGTVHTGSISIDKNTIILSTNSVTPPATPLDPPLWYTICNTVRTLIRVRD
jgi:hypothetical protein